MPYHTQNRRSSAAPRRSYGGNNQRNNRNSNKSKYGVYIDPARFVKVATATETEAYVPTHAFADFQIDDLIKNNLSSNGYITPSPIQDQAIPEALNGKDIIGIASTGTGKTAAFGLPVIQKLLTNPKSNAIVIAPTRELAMQIEEEFKKLAKGSRLTGAVLIGGSSMGLQLRDLRNQPRVIMGTPGRIKDHLSRGSLSLHNFDQVVLDEVDRMLDMGFVNDVTEILEQTSNNKQSYFFSATMDHKVRALIDTFSKDPFTVSLKASSASENVHQDVVRYQSSGDKIDKLHDILVRGDVSKVIVFDETQRNVERLSNELQSRGFSAESIHGGKSQGQRQRALSKFKANQIDILVATDVAARGIDVSDVSHVINFSVPKAYDDYIHRIGRAGRAGQIGYALTFVAH